MSNIKEIHGKPRLHVSFYLEYGRHVGQLRRRHRRRRRAYAPTGNTASHDNHEKINSWVFFSFLYEYGAPLGGPSAAGAPLLFNISNLDLFSKKITDWLLSLLKQKKVAVKKKS